MVTKDGAQLVRLRILDGIGQEHPVAEGMTMKPGKVAVSEHIAQYDEAELISFDQMQSDGLTDLGTVIGSGDPEFLPGDVVIMRPLYGKYIRNFRTGGMVYPLVRFFGCHGDTLMPAGETILGKMVDGIVRPTKNRVLVALDGFDEQTESGLYLPDRAQTTNGMLTVLDSGPQVVDAKPGDRCIYSSYGLLNLPVTDEMKAQYPDHDPKNICLIDEDYLLATIE